MRQLDYIIVFNNSVNIFDKDEKLVVTAEYTQHGMPEIQTMLVITETFNEDDNIIENAF